VLHVIMHAVKFWFGSVGGVSGTGVTIVACARRILPSARNVPELAVTAIAAKSKSVKRWRIEVSFDISTDCLKLRPHLRTSGWTILACSASVAKHRQDCRKAH
jgi:hypothetical protein